MAGKNIPRQNKLDDIREHIASLGITEQDVADAVAWARNTPDTDGAFEALRRWPIADLKLKGPRDKPRKIDL